MRIGSLCSGVGGLEMGLQAVVGGQVAWHAETDRHAATILAHRYPGVPNLGDLTDLTWADHPVDVLTAGFPCQPVSAAGKRRGVSDERWLFDAIVTGLGNMDPRPRLCVFENVLGLLSANGGHAMGRVVHGLASVGYVGRWRVVRAADAGAPHGRARVFIVARDAACDDERDARIAGGSGAGRARLAAGSAGGIAADASGERHGRQPVGAGAGSVGCMAGSSAGEARERERARPVVGDRGAAAPADADIGPLAGAGAARDGLLVAAECGPVAAADPDIARPQGCEPAAGQHLPARSTSADAECSGCDGWPPEPQRGPLRRVVAAGGGEVADAPADADGGRRQERGQCDGGPLRRLDAPFGDDADGLVAWGDYEPAIRRWERILGRGAPRPTEPGRSGERLSPRFVEWMMGLPAGWVTDVPIPRNAQLRALGNGVVPQQAALALTWLLGDCEVGA